MPPLGRPVLLHYWRAPALDGLRRYTFEVEAALQRLGVEARAVASVKHEVRVLGRPVGGYLSMHLAQLVPPLRRGLLHATSFHFATATRRPDVVTFHDIMPLDRPDLYPYGPRLRRLQRRQATLGLRGRQLVAVTQHTKDRMLAHFQGLEPERVTVIHNGVDPSRFHPRPGGTPRIDFATDGFAPDGFATDGSAGPSRADFASGRPAESPPDEFASGHPAEASALEVPAPPRPGGLTLLLWMNWETRKRADLVLQAALQAPDVHVVHVGATNVNPVHRPHFERCQAAIELLRAQGRYTHLGALPDDRLGAVLRGCDALVHLSEDEGFGLPPLEALACGTPVIASDIPPHREILGEAVTYVPFDVPLLVEAFEPLRRAKAGGRLRADVAKRQAHAAKFTWDAAARKLVDVYQAL